MLTGASSTGEGADSCLRRWREMKRASRIALLAWLVACAGLWWEIAILAENAATTYASAVFGQLVEAQLALEAEVRWDVFWAAWRYTSIVPAVVASIVLLIGRERRDVCSKVVVAFLACAATVILLMGVWSGCVAQRFLGHTFQLLR